MIYKVSYVIIGGKHPGAIVNQDEPPRVGEQVTLGEDTCEILEVMDLLPAMGDYAYLHVTCKPVEVEDADQA